MVDIFETWLSSIVIFSLCSGMLLGLQEIAGAMADPFGVDDTDFDTHKLCYDAYRNAVAYLRAKSTTDADAGIGDAEPTVNPIANKSFKSFKSPMVLPPSAAVRAAELNLPPSKDASSSVSAAGSLYMFSKRVSSQACPQQRARVV